MRITRNCAQKIFFYRHPRAGGDPGARTVRLGGYFSALRWIPAFAGMTDPTKKGPVRRLGLNWIPDPSGVSKESEETTEELLPPARALSGWLHAYLSSLFSTLKREIPQLSSCALAAGSAGAGGCFSGVHGAFADGGEVGFGHFAGLFHGFLYGFHGVVASGNRAFEHGNS